MRLHWHRRDLRAPDNTALAWAAERDAVLPVFVFDDAVLEHGSPPRVRFMLDALAALRARYRERGGDLLVRHGDPAGVLPSLCAETDATGALWNRDYSGLARERDDRVRAALAEGGHERQAFHDDLHHEPGSITTNAGEPYSVYSYFWKKWRDREKEPPHPAPDTGALVDPAAVGLDPGHLPTLADLGFDEPAADVEPAGHAAARDRLDSFCEGDIYDYEERRDYPAEGCTSRLSAHLKWGTVGVREVYAATEDAMERAPDEAGEESVDSFRSELAWREFYTHVLYYNPEVVTANYREYEHEIGWRDDPEELAAWRAGETGYPIVDAGMRQLRAEGYMHNRVRMIVASFLTKDLICDWRHGYEHFREYLVDHHTANDNGGWQWAASTGTDAQPYFRIFNPMTQGERYDPEAEYVHEYVPELRGVSAEHVHAWHELSPGRRDQLAPEYPAPVVDHGERREAALAMFRRARGEDEEEGDGE
ncbi:MAG: deoxyribodipyrimidine photo-lyase [Haloarculaceae archaeon]